MIDLVPSFAVRWFCRLSLFALFLYSTAVAAGVVASAADLFTVGSGCLL
jgi:hypothetical protein